jgi:hypothetical protein
MLIVWDEELKLLCSYPRRTWTENFRLYLPEALIEPEMARGLVLTVTKSFIDDPLIKDRITDNMDLALLSHNIFQSLSQANGGKMELG